MKFQGHGGVGFMEKSRKESERGSTIHQRKRGIQARMAVQPLGRT